MIINKNNLKKFDLNNSYPACFDYTNCLQRSGIEPAPWRGPKPDLPETPEHDPAARFQFARSRACSVPLLPEERNDDGEKGAQLWGGMHLFLHLVSSLSKIVILRCGK